MFNIPGFRAHSKENVPETRGMLNMSDIEKMKVSHFPKNVQHVKHVRVSARAPVSATALGSPRKSNMFKISPETLNFHFLYVRHV